MKSTHYFALPFVLAGAFFGLFITGCEVTSKDQQVTVSPDNITLKKGETVRLEASGGDSYTWELDKPTLGTLSSIQGQTVVYTCLVAPIGTAVVQTITVLADVNTGVGTNAVVEQRIGRAYITQTSQGMTLTPSASQLYENNSVTLRVSGGSGGYRWNLSHPTWGTLSSVTGSEVSYTSRHKNTTTELEVQNITVTDDSGASVIGVIYHMPE